MKEEEQINKELEKLEIILSELENRIPYKVSFPEAYNRELLVLNGKIVALKWVLNIKYIKPRKNG